MQSDLNSNEPSASNLISEPATKFYRQLNVAAMSLLIFVLSIHLLREFDTVLQELLIAAFLAYLIVPAHYWLVRHRISSRVSILILLIGFAGSSYGLGHMIYRSVEDLTDKLPRYSDRLNDMLEDVSGRIPGVDRSMIEHLLVGRKRTVDSTVDAARAALGSFFGFFSHATLILIYLIFILAEQVGFHKRIVTAFPADRADQIVSVVRTINDSITQYIVVKTMMSFLTGGLTVVILLLFGVDYAVLWGIIAFLFNYIPYLGSMIAVILPVALCLVQFDIWHAVGLAAVLAVMQNGIGTFVEPTIAGNRLNLSPLVIILSLAFWGSVWGIVGMILAVPMVVILKTIFENVKETKPIAALLSHS